MNSRLEHAVQAVALQLDSPIPHMAQLRDAARVESVGVANTEVRADVVAHRVDGVDLKRPGGSEVDVGRTAIKSGRRDVLLLGADEASPDTATNDVSGAVFVVAA